MWWRENAEVDCRPAEADGRGPQCEEEDYCQGRAIRAACSCQHDQAGAPLDCCVYSKLIVFSWCEVFFFFWAGLLRRHGTMKLQRLPRDGLISATSSMTRLGAQVSTFLTSTASWYWNVVGTFRQSEESLVLGDGAKLASPNGEHRRCGWFLVQRSEGLQSSRCGLLQVMKAITSYELQSRSAAWVVTIVTWYDCQLYVNFMP